MTTATMIRDAIFDRLTSNDYPYNTVRKIPVPQLQSDRLPALTVFVLQGRSAPDGEANVGQPRFVNSDTIAISIARGFEDPVLLEGRVELEIDSILNKILTDPTFINFGPNPLFESVTGITRHWVFPQDGETYFIELRVEITFEYRVEYPPVVEDEFKLLGIRTVFPNGGDPESTQQIVAEYDIPQN